MDACGGEGISYWRGGGAYDSGGWEGLLEPETVGDIRRGNEGYVMGPEDGVPLTCGAVMGGPL